MNKKKSLRKMIGSRKEQKRNRRDMDKKKKNNDCIIEAGI